MKQFDLKQPLNEVDQRQIDLTSHAINRVEMVLQDITGLMDNGAEVYALLLSVAGTVVRGAAIVMQEGWEQRGQTVPLDTCERRAMLDLMVGMTPDDR